MTVGLGGDHREKVAEAIRDAYNEVVFGETNEEAWLRLADAALAALQLTQELRVTEDGEQVAWPPSLEHARLVVEHPIGDAKPIIEARLVGPWEAL